MQVVKGVAAPGLRFAAEDLDAAQRLLPDSWPVRFDDPDLAELTKWIVQARYTGVWPEPSSSVAVCTRTG